VKLLADSESPTLYVSKYISIVSGAYIYVLASPPFQMILKDQRVTILRNEPFVEGAKEKNPNSA